MPKPSKPGKGTRAETPRQRENRQEYNRQVKRIRQQVKRMQDRGYLISTDEILPSRPERPTKRDVERLKKITTPDLYGKAEYVTRYGEVISGTQGRKEERKQSARLAQAVREGILAPSGNKAHTKRNLGREVKYPHIERNPTATDKRFESGTDRVKEYENVDIAIERSVAKRLNMPDRGLEGPAYFQFQNNVPLVEKRYFEQFRDLMEPDGSIKASTQASPEYRLRWLDFVEQIAGGVAQAIVHEAYQDVNSSLRHQLEARGVIDPRNGMQRVQSTKDFYSNPDAQQFSPASFEANEAAARYYDYAPPSGDLSNPDEPEPAGPGEDYARNREEAIQGNEGIQYADEFDDDYPREEDVVVRRLIEKLDPAAAQSLSQLQDKLGSWSRKIEWSQGLGDLKEQDVNVLKNILSAAIAKYGKETVARRVQANAQRINEIVDQVMYESGSKYHSTGRAGMRSLTTVFWSILNDQPISADLAQQVYGSYDEDPDEFDAVNGGYDSDMDE